MYDKAGYHLDRRMKFELQLDRDEKYPATKGLIGIGFEGKKGS